MFLTKFSWITTFNQVPNGGTATWFFTGFPPASSGFVGINNASGPISHRSQATDGSAVIVPGTPVINPAATIFGVGLFLVYRTDAQIIQNFNLQVAKNGVFLPANLSDGIIPPTTFVSKLYGGVGQFWGTTWKPSDFNANLNYGVQVQTTNGTIFDSYYLNGVQIWVYWGFPPPVSEPPLQNLRHYRMRR
jgi:hypothetical protein